MATIKLRRGFDAAQESAAEGEPMFDMQDYALYVGVGSHNEHVVGRTMIGVSYLQLRTLCEEGKLFPGMQYCITDFVTLTNLDELLDDNPSKVYRSAGNMFQLVVTADTNFTLNETARAICDVSYFENCNLAAWEIKYSLINNQTLYTWAKGDYYETKEGESVILSGDNVQAGYTFTSSLGRVHTITDVRGGTLYTNNDNFLFVQERSGFGVIYHMKDEYGNEANYDFKNIQFKLFGEFENGCAKDLFPVLPLASLGLIAITPKTYQFYYTFYYDIEDATVIGTNFRPVHNSIKNNLGTGESRREELSFILFDCEKGACSHNCFVNSKFGSVHRSSELSLKDADTFIISDSYSISLSPASPTLTDTYSEIFIIIGSSGVQIQGRLTESVIEQCTNSNIRGYLLGQKVYDLHNSSVIYSECESCNYTICNLNTAPFVGTTEYNAFVTCKGKIYGLVNDMCKVRLITV